jgi:hypothetical protein
MDFLYAPLLVFLGFVFINFFKRQLSNNKLGILRKLWGFHLLVTVGFYYYTRNGGGDAWAYWTVAKEMEPSNFWLYLIDSTGTYFLYALNYIPANILGMGFFSNTLLFSFIGFMGMVFFLVIAFKTIPYNTKYGRLFLFPTLFFLPNLHFWSSGVGKDSVLFFCVGLFVYCLLNLSKRSPLLFITLLVAYLLRPHIVLFLVISFGVAYLMDSQIKPFKRVFFSVLLLGVGFAILPTVMDFANIGEASVDGFEEFSENKSDLLSRGHTGSRIDGSSSSYTVKVFAFLYRPLFFDINGLPAVIASFENLLLLLISLKVLFSKPITAFRKSPFIIKGLLLFLILGTLTFSATLGNVGIMIRMRNMFLPGFIIFMMWTLSYAHERKLKSQNKHS